MMNSIFSIGFMASLVSVVSSSESTVSSSVVSDDVISSVSASVVSVDSLSSVATAISASIPSPSESVVRTKPSASPITFLMLSLPTVASFSNVISVVVPSVITIFF